MFGLEVVVILGASVLVGMALSRPLRVAAPLLLLLIGIVLGFAPALRAIHLPPELVLLIFLPALLFWDSLTTSVRAIRRSLRGIILTSTVLVILTAAAVAWVANLLGMPWGAAWVLGAALAPTDATAVAVLARAMPRRNLIVLQAESLVNDGTALVLYGIALTAVVADVTLTPLEISGEFVLSYAGGIAAGALVAWISVMVLRRLNDPVLKNIALLLVPFASFLLAEVIHASGVLAAVVAGLILSQVGPRISSPESRRQSEAFWSLSTALLNGSLFVLIGIEIQSVVRAMPVAQIGLGLIAAVVVWAVILGVRYVFLVVSAHLIRLIDRRPSQRARRVSERSRVVSALAGFRGAVSLAAALAVPLVIDSGGPFPGRDLIVFVTAGVVVLTLVVQGLLLPAAVRWARFPADDDGASEEERMARLTATAEAFAALPEIAAALEVDDDVLARTRAEFEEHQRVLLSRPGLPEDELTLRQEDQYNALRLAILRRKRDVVIRLRDEQKIDDAVLLRIQAQLDVEEIRQSPPRTMEG